MAYENIFSPLKLGSVTCPNRIFSSAHVPAMDQDGHWTEQTVKYYEGKAKGGIGLIVTGAVEISPEASGGTTGRGFETSYSDGVVEWFKKGTDAVHAYGVPIIVQLWHGGRQCGPTTESMLPLYSPSPEPCPVIGEVPKEMESEDIEKTIQDFTNAAQVAKEGGFDGVELHGAHGYLISQMLSPFFNKRTDEYGGSLDNRLRFLLDTIAAIRQAVGPDFVIGYKFSGDELLPGGLTVEDMKGVVTRVEATGMVNYFTVSVGTYLTMPPIIPPMYYPLGINVANAAAIKEVVNLPVMVIGRIKNPDQAEEVISSNCADMVAMTRAVLCDSELPIKMREGREAEIRNCIACNQKCWGNLVAQVPITCTLNPAAGRENDPFWAELNKVETKKKVIIVGGGPAGCEAARVLAERGCEVILYEKGSELGGQLLTVQKASGREEWQNVNRYYTRELERLGVNLVFNMEATADLILQQSPDAVVIATGSTPRIEPFSHLPPINGLENGNVVNVRDVLDGKIVIGQNVVVYCGEYHFQGVTVADTMLDQGKTVEIVTPTIAPAPHGLAEGLTWEVINMRLHQKNIQNIRVLSAVTDFADGLVKGINVFNEVPFEIPCDTLISSFGGVADESLYFALKGEVAELHRIGDCVTPRRADNAIYDGAKLGRLI